MANQGKQQGQPNRNAGGGKNFSSQEKNYESKNKNTEEDYLEEVKKIFGKQFDEILKEEKDNYNEFIDKLKEYVKGKLSVTTSQLRNVYGAVKATKDFKDLWKLRPQIAYTAGRATQQTKPDEIKKLMFLFDYLIARVNDNSQLKAFQDFFEAIIAYHKFYGGKN